MTDTDAMPGRRLTPGWIVLGLAVVFLATMAWIHRYSIDDAFINYRVVQQINAGNGPVFNAGERVETFTSVAWLAVLWIADVVLPFRLEWIGMIGGIVLALIGVILAAFASATLIGRGRDGVHAVRLVPLGALVFVAMPSTWRLVAMGLEDGLSVAWLGASAWVLARWASGGKALGWPSAVLLGFGVLVRPDLAPFCLLFLLVVVVCDRGWWHRLAMLVSALAVPAAYEVFRMGYFGVLVPNTAFTKSASLTRWGDGWWYLANSLGTYWFWVPVVALACIGYGPLLAGLRTAGIDPASSQRRIALVSAAFALGALLGTFYVVRMGGDYIATRLFFPSVFAFVCPVMFVEWPRFADVRRSVPAVTVLVWLVICAGFLRIAGVDATHGTVTLADSKNLVDFLTPAHPRPGRVYVNRVELPYPGAMPSRAIVISYGVGKVAYALPTNVYVFDELGLALPVAAHLQLRERGLPGHEKVLPSPWVAALTTARGSPVKESEFPQAHGLIPFHGRTMRFPDQGDPRGRSFDERVGVARAVMGCRAMSAFTASYQGPITWHRFASNLVHSLQNTRLTVPGEPADAARALCTPTERAHMTVTD